MTYAENFSEDECIALRTELERSSYRYCEGTETWKIIKKAISAFSPRGPRVIAMNWNEASFREALASRLGLTVRTLDRLILECYPHGVQTTSAPSAPGSESASTESATSSAPAEDILSAALWMLEKRFDSFELRASRGLERLNYSYGERPPMDATDSEPSHENPPKNGRAYRWSEALDEWVRA